MNDYTLNVKVYYYVIKLLNIDATKSLDGKKIKQTTLIGCVNVK